MQSITINTATQHLFIYENGQCLQHYLVSTARNGTGQRLGSEQTPLGRHVIRAKIGNDQPVNTVFVGRRPTGEIFTPELDLQHPNRDWILTRILWLSGMEVGKNRLGEVDTMRRMIYIHGTPDRVVLGQPGSRGCIRMANSDLLELYDWVRVGTPVLII